MTRRAIVSLLGIVALLAASWLPVPVPGAAPAKPAEARTGTYKLAILRVLYSGEPAPPHTFAQLQAAGTEIHDFYNLMSNGLLDMQVSVRDVSLTNTLDFYFKPCQPDGVEARVPCPPTLREDAAQAAAAGGFSFAGIDGISIVTPRNTVGGFCGVYYPNPADPPHPFVNSDVSVGGQTISRPGVSGTFQISYDYECSFPPALHTPGPSTVPWNGWAHEIGHQLQFSDGITLGGVWNGHPSGYASGYDLMDSCYPCDEGVFGLSGPPVNTGAKLVFPGWLPSSKVVSVDAPTSGIGGQTVVLSPVEELPASVTAAQGIKIPIAPGKYYTVEAKRRLRSDNLNAGPGIWDEGVHIREVEESRDPPVRNIDSCQTTVVGGCIYQSDPTKPLYDTRTPNCLTTSGGGTPLIYPDVPAYCWPFPLWHVGDAYWDSFNFILIRVDAAVGNGWAVTVTRGVPPGHPDMFIVPWLTPPMNTYETVDIWVDSSCNGYEDTVGASGLRYGRRGDGTVIGNGDDPCANHENRIYAHIRNPGDQPANNVRVHVSVSNPLGTGVGPDTSFVEVGVATSTGFPALASLPAGGSADVWVPWTPSVTLTPAEIASGHFAFHSCVQVNIETVSGEVVVGNQLAQENFDNFEAIRDPFTSDYTIPDHNIYLHNPYGDNFPPSGPRTFLLGIKSQLPSNWTLAVGGGLPSLTLNPSEIRNVPVHIAVPSGSPVHQTYLLQVEARTILSLVNAAIPPTWSTSSSYQPTHQSAQLVGGVMLAVTTYDRSDLSLTAATDATFKIKASGVLSPAHSTRVSIDYTDSLNNTVTRVVSTDASGNYSDLFAPPRSGDWRIRAFWQGDADHAGAISSQAVAFVQQAPTCATDYLGNGSVNQADVYQIARFWLKPAPPNSPYTPYDLNQDQHITLSDIMKVAAQVGKPCP